MQEKDNWDEHWEQFDEALMKNPAQYYRFKQVKDELRFVLKQKPDSSLLDVGCGQGVLLTILREAFPTLTYGGIEYSEYGVKITQEKLPDCKVIQGDLIENSESLKEFDNWADVITCSEVLEHVDDPGLFLRNCLPLIKPNGYIIVTVPGGPRTAFDKLIGHRPHFSHSRLDKLLTESGYSIIHNRQAGFPWHNIYRLILLARGEKLSTDVGDGGSWAANVGMKIFSVLFKLNLSNTPWGWQNVVLAQKVANK